MLVMLNQAAKVISHETIVKCQAQRKLLPPPVSPLKCLSCIRRTSPDVDVVDASMTDTCKLSTRRSCCWAASLAGPSNKCFKLSSSTVSAARWAPAEWPISAIRPYRHKAVIYRETNFLKHINNVFKILVILKQKYDKCRHFGECVSTFIENRTMSFKVMIERMPIKSYHKVYYRANLFYDCSLSQCIIYFLTHGRNNAQNIKLLWFRALYQKHPSPKAESNKTRNTA